MPAGCVQDSERARRRGQLGNDRPETSAGGSELLHAKSNGDTTTHCGARSVEHDDEFAGRSMRSSSASGTARRSNESSGASKELNGVENELQEREWDGDAKEPAKP